MLNKITAKFPGTKTLVVEDFIINQELVKEILEMMECIVDVAENGIEALELYEPGKYDVIFMDVQMPEMDGYDATKKIREIEESNLTPIIAITANALDGDKEKCIESGMDDYISKPIKAEDIKDALAKFIKV